MGIAFRFNKIYIKIKKKNKDLRPCSVFLE